MGATRGELERWIGAVIVPEVRVGGTIAGPDPIVPSDAYLARFPPSGVIVFGRTPGGASDPRALVERVRRNLRRAGAETPFAACDLEQGAGLHFPGATRLAPALALAASSRPDALERAGAITAAEARARGIELVLAPVVDVNTRRDNPIIAVRSFGDEAASVARRALAFAAGLHAGGAGACAKHFPGHGDTSQDSHRELALVARDRAGFDSIDFVPYRALFESGVECVMVAHVDAPSLSGEPGLPSTLSRRVVTEILRGELGFRGAILTDAMNMRALTTFAKPHARALAAGCDALLCPADPLVAAEELLTAVERGELATARLQDAAQRVARLRRELFERAPTPPSAAKSEGEGDELAASALVVSPARWPWKLGHACEVLAPMPAGLGLEGREAIHSLRRAVVDPSGSNNALIPVVAEVRAFDGRYGIASDDLVALEAKVADLQRLGWKVALAWFASPQTVPSAWWKRADIGIVLAFAPTPPMVRSVTEFLAGRARPTGSLPTALG